MSDAVASLVAQQVHRQQNAGGDKPAPTVVQKLFMLMHGAYGNVFLSKFSTGEHDDEGKDKGVKSAMQVWVLALRRFPVDVIETAAYRCQKDRPDFPPTLPQFEAVCAAVMPRKTYAEEHGLPRLPAPAPAPVSGVPHCDEQRDGKDWARRIIARHEAGQTINRTSLRFAREALRLA